MITTEQRLRIQNEFRIPVDSSHPGKYWIAALDGESSMPTDIELRQIRSFIEFIVGRVFGENYGKRILAERPLVYCGDHNTTVFLKGLRDDSTKEGWRYRKMRWRTGPTYMPSIAEGDYRPLTLVEIMDLMEKLIFEEWNEWKQAHPEIFPPEQTQPAI